MDRQTLIALPSPTKAQLDLLVTSFGKEMVYDAHQPRTTYNRSDCAPALLKHGVRALWAIARHLNKMLRADARHRDAIGFMYLLFDFCDKLGYKAPYGKDVPYIKMTLRRWRKFIYEPKVRIPIVALGDSW